MATSAPGFPIAIRSDIKYALLGLVTVVVLLLYWALFPRQVPTRLPTFQQTRQTLAEMPHEAVKHVARVLPKPVAAHIIGAQTQGSPKATPTPKPTPNPDWVERMALYKRALRTGMGRQQDNDQNRVRVIPQAIPTMAWGQGWAQR